MATKVVFRKKGYFWTPNVQKLLNFASSSENDPFLSGT